MPERIYLRIPDPADRAHGYSLQELLSNAKSLDVVLVPVQPVPPSGILVKGDCGTHDFVDQFFDRLGEDLNAGHAVIVPTRRGRATAHYYLLYAKTDAGFIALDPAQSGKLTLPRAELRKLMCSFGYIALMTEAMTHEVVIH